MSTDKDSSEPAKSNDNRTLIEKEISKNEPEIDIDYPLLSEKEDIKDQMSQCSSSNYSIYSNHNAQSYSISSGFNKSSCQLADLLFLSSVYILCENCKDNYYLKFQNLRYINIECECKLIINCLISDFIKDYCSKKPNNYGCEWHGWERTDKYCLDCKINICKKCLAEKSQFYNDTGLHTKHETHTLINLLDVKKEIEEINKYIEEKLDDNDNIKNIMGNYVKDYENFPSYNGYKTIKKFLKVLPLKEPSCGFLKKEVLHIINSLPKLKEKIKESDLLCKININEEKTNEMMDDLSLFEGKKFCNLKRLIMNNISLKNISGMANCSFPNLKLIEIESNELTNDCIKVFNKLDLPKIHYISLFDNKITSTEIFGIAEKYKTLKVFFIGKNQFDDTIVKNDKTTYEFPNIETLGITNNFSKETNNFIFTNLNLENIKILYIYGNYFSSFEKFEKIKFKRLEKFWFRGMTHKGFITDIKEIMYFQGKENIKNICLKENKINNIEELVNIIPSFPKLEFLNIEDNEIDHCLIEKILSEIHKIKGFENFKIQYKINKK